MKLNLLGSRAGRLTAFFLLYVTEGIPLGFTATAVAMQMRREGLGPAEIGVFVGTLYLPWAWKWLIGPVVDVVYSDKLGRRRAWIVGAQTLMALMLVSTVAVDFSTQLKLFTGLILIVNVFGAAQDVAIDALACNTLEEGERGFANGLMFAGAYTGQAAGGAGILYLSDLFGSFPPTYFVVAGLVLCVTIFVALPMKEKPGPKRPDGPALDVIGGEIKTYVKDAIRAFLGSRAAMVAVLFALLPTGGMLLSLNRQNIAIELGMSDSDFATLSLVTTLTSAAGCVIGGFLSDILGRRRTLAVYIACTIVPTVYFAFVMQDQNWIFPIDTTAEDAPKASSQFILSFWIACMVFSIFNGLMYGTRTALFMDVVTPKVAATQFTAYMSLMNVTIWYTSTWQGFAIESWGYPVTLAVDAVAGVLCILCLPFITKAVTSSRDVPDVPAEGI